MKKGFIGILCLSVFCYCSNLQARDTLLEQKTYDESYSYELSDSAQKKQAIGITVWGFIMVAFTALITVFTPHSQSLNPEPAPDSTTTGTGLI